MTAADARELENALARNIFAGANSAGGRLGSPHYARAALRQFEAQEDGAVLRGEVAFPNPATIADGCAEAPGQIMAEHMAEHEEQKSIPAPWQVPVAVEDIAETGQHFDLVADADVRAAVAAVAGLRDLPRLQQPST